jgi:hypothetical protein
MGVAKGDVTKNGIRYRAYVLIDRKKINLGSYGTIEEAARARDRGVKELGLDRPLNFPDPTQPEAAWAGAGAEKKPYRGISKTKYGKYVASISTASKRINMGSYPTAEEAAHAYDRGIKELGLNRPLNFPDEIHAQAPPSPANASAQTPVPAPAPTQAPAQVSQEEKYKGISRTPSGKYRALVSIKGGKINAGLYDTPAEAARAYDRVAREHKLDRPLDFPDAPTPAQAQASTVEASRLDLPGVDEDTRTLCGKVMAHVNANGSITTRRAMDVTGLDRDRVRREVLKPLRAKYLKLVFDDIKAGIHTNATQSLKAAAEAPKQIRRLVNPNNSTNSSGG